MCCAAADAQAYICSGGEGGATSIAQASARGFARAVAEASVHGFPEGEISCHLDDSARTGSAANAWLEDYIAVFASSVDCKHCQNYADSWAPIRDQVFLNALDSLAAREIVRF